MFKQIIKNSYQAEVPDVWLTEGNPWEIPRKDITFKVGFGGKTDTSNGKTSWTPSEEVRWYLQLQALACSLYLCLH
jgi:starch phosphorylase